MGINRQLNWNRCLPTNLDSESSKFWWTWSSVELTLLPRWSHLARKTSGEDVPGWLPDRNMNKRLVVNSWKSFRTKSTPCQSTLSVFPDTVMITSNFWIWFRFNAYAYQLLMSRKHSQVDLLMACPIKFWKRMTKSSLSLVLRPEKALRRLCSRSSVSILSRQFAALPQLLLLPADLAAFKIHRDTVKDQKLVIAL